jgi:hypothetical protein
MMRSYTFNSISLSLSREVLLSTRIAIIRLQAPFYLHYIKQQQHATDDIGGSGHHHDPQNQLLVIIIIIRACFVHTF